MTVDAEPASETWREIQHEIEHLSDLAKDDVSPARFFSQLAGSLRELTRAAACEIWVPTTAASNGSWKRVAAATEESSTPYQAVFTAEQLAATTSETLVSRPSAWIKAGRPKNGPTVNGGATDVFLRRVQVRDEIVVVIRIDHDPSQLATYREGTEHLASVGAEIASEFHRNWHYRELSDREEHRQDLDRFLDHIHQSYDLRHVARVVVDEGIDLLDCDRISILMTRSRRRCQLLAVSGVQKPDRRSATVRCIEAFAENQQDSVKPEWHEDSTDEGTESVLRRYFDETNARYVGVLPLTSDHDPNQKSRRIGTLIVEVLQSDQSFDRELLPSRANWLARHSSNALSNAVQVGQLPLLGLSRWIDRKFRFRNRMPWLALLSLAIVAVVGYLAAMPTKFEIMARGKLEPVIRESVYAPRAGTVIEFPFLKSSAEAPNSAEEVTVDRGQTLVRMESADLDYELTTLLGEQATVDQQLETIAAVIGQFSGRDAEARKRYDELTAQSAELKVKKASIARRILLVNRERERLSIKSGITGRLLTWDLVNELKLRPVQQGDFLLEVVDTQGPWQIELFVRDRHVGYVKRAYERDDRSNRLAVSFFHLSDPETKYTGTVQSMAMSTEVYPEYGSAVRLTASIDDQDRPPSFRPGTTLAAKIDCGDQPWAYVLCYDLIHTIRMWGLF
ncbi:MAG: HlyD family secretion protein [Planctomycetota bacterium]